MMYVIEQIERHAKQRGQTTALQTTGAAVSYETLQTQIDRAAKWLESFQCNCIALALNNSMAWIVIDLAAKAKGIVLVPVPHFFSVEQLQHLMSDAGVDVLINASPQGNNGLAHLEPAAIEILSQMLYAHRIQPSVSKAEAKLPTDSVLLSYTSGSSAAPKGVVLRKDQLDATVKAVCNSLPDAVGARHLCALPFSLLLENVIGVHAVLARGGCCLVAGFDELGLTGSSKLNVQSFVALLMQLQPTSLITVPALLCALIETLEANSAFAHSFQYIAVGGAPIADSVLHKADALALPVYQGYGMTECCSVVSLNTPEHNRMGSVGKPLPHVEVRISSEGEILVGGNSFSGYLGQKTRAAAVYNTGDLGRLDDDGYLYVTGRMSSIYNTAFGRNIAPEWLEAEVLSQPLFAQCIVFGAGSSYNTVVLVCEAAQQIDSDTLQLSLHTVNKKLPDYARIHRFIVADAAFSAANGLLKPSGVIDRKAVIRRYQNTLPIPLNPIAQ